MAHPLQFVVLDRLHGELHERRQDSLPFRVEPRRLACCGPGCCLFRRRSRTGGAAQDRVQRLAGLGGVAGRDRQGLVQGSRRRRAVRMVRLRAVDGRVLRRQGRRRHDDQRRRAGHRRGGREERHDPDHRLLQRQRHDRRQASIRKPGRAQGQEDRPRSRVRRAPVAAQRSRESRHEGDRRRAGEREDQRDAAGAGVGSGRGDRRLAAQFRCGAEGGSRRAADLYLGASARADLRRDRGQPEQPGHPTRRLGKARDGLGPRRELHQRSAGPSTTR